MISQWNRIERKVELNRRILFLVCNLSIECCFHSGPSWYANKHLLTSAIRVVYNSRHQIHAFYPYSFRECFQCNRNESCWACLHTWYKIVFGRWIYRFNYNLQKNKPIRNFYVSVFFNDLRQNVVDLWMKCIVWFWFCLLFWSVFSNLLLRTL